MSRFLARLTGGVFFLTLIFLPVRSQEPLRAPVLFEPCVAPAPDRVDVAKMIARLGDADASKRADAARKLGESCDTRAADPLVSRLRDADADVRIAVVEALGRLGDRGSVEALIEAIDDPDWRVRAALGPALCSFQYSPASNAVLNALVNPGDRIIADEGDLRARCLGILAINQLRDVRYSRKAISFLFLFLNHRNESFRTIAQQTALGLKETRNGFHELIAILKQHNNPDFRRQAAYWLGRLGFDEARPALTEASSSDRDPGVRRVAAEALAGKEEKRNKRK